MSADIPHDHAIDMPTLHRVVSIVSAYVSHNPLRPADLPNLIASVHGSISHLADANAPTEAKADNPAVPVKKSVQKDFIVCLEDGKKFKSLRRHLNSHHGMTPDQYRAKWNLGQDYPMVAPAYSATRSKLAKDSGLGQVSRPAVAPPEPAPATERKAKRARKKPVAA